MTQLSEATQESVVTAKPQELLYCILHEQMVKAELAECGMGHVQITGDTLDYCCFEGGYAFVPPPADEFPLDWAAQPAELSDDERAQAEIGEMGIWGRFE